MNNKRILKFCKYCGLIIHHPKNFCNLDHHIKYKNFKKIEDWLQTPELFTSPRPFMKKWLIEKFGEKCSRCEWSEINQKTKKVPIEMHHRDGNWKNNIPNNLCLLCPNCHSLTPTYRFGNVGNGREWSKEYYKGKTTRK